MNLKDTLSSLSKLSASVEQKDSDLDSALMTLSFAHVYFQDTETSDDSSNSESIENSEKNIEMSDNAIKQNINCTKDTIKDDCKTLAVIKNEKSEDDSYDSIDVEDEIEITVNPLILLFDENNKIKVLTHFDESYDEYLLSYTDYLWDLIKTNESLDMIKRGLHKLLIYSHNKIVATYLIKHHVLQGIMEQVKNKPKLMEICFSIILKISKICNICKSEQTIINWIGNFDQFAMLILNQLKSTNSLVLNSLLKILQLTVHNIKIKNYESHWLFHFKNYGSFGYDINAILRSHYHEKVTMTAIELIRDITKIKLPNRRTLLEELFVISELSSALMISSAKVLVAKRKLDSPINLELYLYNWLAIIANIKSYMCITFERNDEREKRLFMKILTVILHPYQQKGFSFVGREIKLDLHVIFKCLRLLFYIHMYFHVPMVIDRILMKITLKLQEDIDIKETSFEEDTKKLIHYLLNELKYLWTSLIQCFNAEYIVELMKLFEPIDHEYFIDLASCHSQVKKNSTIINALKKID